MTTLPIDTGVTPANLGLETEGQSAGMDGLTALKNIVNGTLPSPPAFGVFPTCIEEVARGRAVLRTVPGTHFLNPKGDVHGGYTMSVLVSGLACAVQSTLDADQGFSTLEMKTNFAKPVMPGLEELHVRAEVVQAGSRVAVAEARLTDDRDRLYGLATATFLLFTLPALPASSST